MRKTIRAPITGYAQTLLMRELCKLKASGENPQDCLDQSTRNSWRDVYPLKDKGLRRAADTSEIEKIRAHKREPMPAAVKDKIESIIRRVS